MKCVGSWKILDINFNHKGKAVSGSLELELDENNAHLVLKIGKNKFPPLTLSTRDLENICYNALYRIIRGSRLFNHGTLRTKT